MIDATTRPLTGTEEDHIMDVLRRCREHFHEWQGYEGAEYKLLKFALYEGCAGSVHCGQTIAEAAPFALGKELVTHYGFSWTMVDIEGRWRYAVCHSALSDPIVLDALEDGRWNCEDYENERPCPGEVTLDSLDHIVQQIRQALRCNS